MFLPDGSNHWALTGTSEGCVVIWETAGLYHNRKEKGRERGGGGIKREDYVCFRAPVSVDSLHSFHSCLHIHSIWNIDFITC